MATNAGPLGVWSIRQGCEGNKYCISSGKNPRYGAREAYTQYSYLTRAPWYVGPGDPKNAHLSMIYFGFRYLLPSTSGTLLRVPYPNREEECAGPRITFNFAGRNFARCSTLRQLCTSTECTRIE